MRKETDWTSIAGTVTVLLVSPLEQDHRQLRHIISHSNWVLHDADSRRDALAMMNKFNVPTLISERQLPDGTWRDLLADLTSFRDAPNLIVTSRLPDQRLWAEVLNLGAYDLLAKPFSREEVIRVVRLAWLNWKDRVDLGSAGRSRTAGGGA